MSSNLNNFLDYLQEVFINSLSIIDTIDNQDFFLSLKSLPSSDFKQAIIQKIIDFEKCSFQDCLSPGVLLNCSHKLCLQHSYTNPCMYCQQESCNNHARFYCRTCNYQLKEDEIIKLQNIKCKNCFNTFNQSCFYLYSCKHECLNCLNPALTRSKSCKICGFKYENSENFNNSCESCSVNFHISDLFITSCSHFLCLSCMTTTYKDKKCKVCRLVTNPRFLYKMETFQKCKCQSCSTRIKSINSVFCSICSQDFCQSCYPRHSHLNSNAS